MSLVFASPGSILGQLGRNAILARLLSDAVEALECDTERVRASLLRAAALVAEAPSSVPDTPKGGLAPSQAKRAVALIDEGLESRTEITQLAADVKLSQSHFSRAFKVFFGRTPKRFILERRVERALSLMLATDSRLCDIALACGFADQAHFSRVFRQVIGLTPNAWRRARVSA